MNALNLGRNVAPAILREGALGGMDQKDICCHQENLDTKDDHNCNKGTEHESVMLAFLGIIDVRSPRLRLASALSQRSMMIFEDQKSGPANPG